MICEVLAQRPARRPCVEEGGVNNVSSQNVCLRNFAQLLLLNYIIKCNFTFSHNCCSKNESSCKHVFDIDALIPKQIKCKTELIPVPLMFLWAAVMQQLSQYPIRGSKRHR
eukprot:Blabericola_migrator_1__1297@NODE_1337_length_4766_cov_21_491594_g561_i1_p4_GENE_NODE_1337_length_4766_cov_21_491594_g561_i1NODE_1337_length_4766_cov_21_491594_g561_i1_p4_ORF_typecomplete_len111_score6_23Plasmodium_Vir/PF05795_11/0_033_NODE_1337_length_4766_cov_21_491594_g561_i119272259